MTTKTVWEVEFLKHGHTWTQVGLYDNEEAAEAHAAAIRERGDHATCMARPLQSFFTPKKPAAPSVTERRAMSWLGGGSACN